MKTIIQISFALLAMGFLLTACVDNDYYYYPDNSPSSETRNVRIQGIVSSVDSLLVPDSIDIAYFPLDWWSDSSYTSPDSVGNFKFNYSLSYGTTVRLVFMPSDSNYKDLDTNIELAGRDLTTGIRTLSIVLDTL